MKQGKTIQELGMELQRQHLNRQDFIADTRALELAEFCPFVLISRLLML